MILVKLMLAAVAVLILQAWQLALSRRIFCERRDDDDDDDGT